MMTVEPMSPLVGVTLEMVGAAAGIAIKLVAPVVAVPREVVTVIGPGVA